MIGGAQSNSYNGTPSGQVQSNLLQNQEAGRPNDLERNQDNQKE